MSSDCSVCIMYGKYRPQRRRNVCGYSCYEGSRRVLFVPSSHFIQQYCCSQLLVPLASFSSWIGISSPYHDCPTQKIHSKQVRRSSLLSDRETEMYAGRVACCPWWVTVCRRDRQVDGQTDGRQTVTLRFTLDAVTVMIWVIMHWNIIRICN